jgi:hypothetical protein
MPRREELLGSNPAGRAFLSSELPFFLLFRLTQPSLFAYIAIARRPNLSTVKPGANTSEPTQHEMMGIDTHIEVGNLVKKARVVVMP